jgi:hypothetical protein
VVIHHRQEFVRRVEVRCGVLFGGHHAMLLDGYKGRGCNLFARERNRS